jgi:hypothetical protein
MKRLFQNEGQGGDIAVIERNRSHLVIVGSPELAFPRFKESFFLGHEGMVGAKNDLAAPPRAPFPDGQGQGVSGDKIPGISR